MLELELDICEPGLRAPWVLENVLLVDRVFLVLGNDGQRAKLLRKSSGEKTHNEVQIPPPAVAVQNGLGRHVEFEVSFIMSWVVDRSKDVSAIPFRGITTDSKPRESLSKCNVAIGAVVVNEVLRIAPRSI